MSGGQTIAEHKEIVHEELERASETEQETRKYNPVGILGRRFEHLYGLNTPFLDEAKEMAELVVPGMYEGTPLNPYGTGTSLFGLDNFASANQSLIAKGVLLLSWSMANVVLPADGDYFKRSIEPSVGAFYDNLEEQRKQISQQEGQPTDPADFIPINTQINQEFLRDDIIIKKQIAASNHQEVLAKCFFHSLTSGISVFAHLTLTQAKYYTIQNSAVVFDSAHEAVEIIVVDRLPLTSLPEDVRKKVSGGLSKERISNLEPSRIFVTVVTQQVKLDPETMRINTEIEGMPIDELSFDIPADAPVMIALPFMFMNNSDPRPIGWLTFNRGDLNSYENTSLSIESMVAAASVCILGLPPGKRITSEELRDAMGLTVIPISDVKAKLEAVVAPISQNLQQVLGRHDKLERTVMLLFGMDFAIQRQGERVTAEEIKQLSDGLMKLFGSTMKQMERMFQQKHSRREFYLAEEDEMIRPVDKKMYVMSLTAGLQAQEAQNSVGKMDQLLARGQQLATLQQAGMTKFNPDIILRWYAQQMKLDATDKVMTPEEEAEVLGVGQLLTIIRQLGPQGPSVVAQMLQQLTEQAGEGQQTPPPAQQPGAQEAA